MTERLFRKRLLQLWLSFTVVGLLVARILSLTALRLPTQKAVFVGFWLSVLLAGVVLYFRGSVTEHAEREQILAEAHVKRPGWVVLFCSMFMLLISKRNDRKKSKGKCVEAGELRGTIRGNDLLASNGLV